MCKIFINKLLLKEVFVDKYLTFLSNIFEINICNVQIYQHVKNLQPICKFHYTKPPMRCTKILLALEEENCTLTFHQPSTCIFKTLINIGRIKETYFDKFLTNLQLDKQTYVIAFRCI
jgi:hypothetical protein